MLSSLAKHCVAPMHGSKTTVVPSDTFTAISTIQSYTHGAGCNSIQA
jgi:hypothetical protein